MAFDFGLAEKKLGTAELIVIICIGVLIVLLNSVEIFLLQKSKRSLKPHEILISSLAFSDCLVAFLGIVCGILLSTNGRSAAVQETLFMLLFLSLSSSNIIIVAIAVDRFIAVKYPLRHLTLLSKKRMIILLIIFWMIKLFPCSTLLTLRLTGVLHIPLLLVKPTVISVTIILSGIFFVIIYTGIACVVHRNTLKMKLQTQGLSEQSKIIEQRVIITAVCVVITYILFTYPLAIEILAVSNMSFITTFLLYTKSAVDPVVYFYRSYVTDICSICKKRPADSSSSHSGNIETTYKTFQGE